MSTRNTAQELINDTASLINLLWELEVSIANLSLWCRRR